MYADVRKGGDGKPKVEAGLKGLPRFSTPVKGFVMNNIVYIVGAVVIILAVLSFVGLR